jgi:hypothetical protein
MEAQKRLDRDLERNYRQHTDDAERVYAKEAADVEVQE